MEIQVGTRAASVMGAVSLGLSLTVGMPEVMQAQEAAEPISGLSYDAGLFNAEVQVNPLMRRLLGRTLKQEIPSKIQLEAKDLAGRISLEPIHSLAAESGIALSSETEATVVIQTTKLLEELNPVAERALRQLSDRYGLPSDITVEQLNEVFQYQIAGTGTVHTPQTLQALQTEAVSQAEGEAKTANSTSFEFTYDSQTEALKTQDFDRLLSQCQRQTCVGAIAGDLDINLSIEGLLQVSEELDWAIPQSVRRLLQLATVRRFASLDFAAGQFNAALETQPQIEDRATTSTMTQGDFVLHAQRSTLPWSLLFSVPTPEPTSSPTSRSTTKTHFE